MIRAGVPTPRLVIDTNIFVSSIFGGKPRQVLNLFRDGAITLIVSEEIIAEYVEVLARFGGRRREVEDVFTLLTESPNVAVVAPTERVQAVPDDPDDTMFLECAVAGAADAIVSGDTHLLDLGEFASIPILSPADLLSRYSK